ncbi:MAG: C-terminal helicase domain-containing protein [Candidatus Heimdallarchaeota archaeon]
MKDRAHPDGRAWEVAVLTFYRGQERLLRQKVASVLNTYPRRVFRYWTGGKDRVRIEVCTVDRFQGHEADYVMLSLVRTNAVGFLDSPNRLNVALTRARYQLMIFGHRAFFQRKYMRDRARFLYDLACDEVGTPTHRPYATKKHRKRS